MPALATLSTGERWSGRKAPRSLLDRLHRRIDDLRRDGLHKPTTSATRRFHTIGNEDLNAEGRLANPSQARAIADMGFHQLRSQLSCKAAWRGGHLIVVDQWYPSSRTCWCCGHRLQEFALGTRNWTCPGCEIITTATQRGRQPEEHGDDFCRNCLWRGRLWPRARARDEVDSGEAGSQRQKLAMVIFAQVLEWQCTSLSRRHL